MDVIDENDNNICRGNIKDSVEWFKGVLIPFITGLAKLAQKETRLFCLLD